MFAFIRLAAVVVAASLLAACTDPEVRLQERLKTARADIEAGEVERALNLLNDLNDRFPERAAVLYELSRAHQASGDTLFAAIFLEQTARMDESQKALLRQAARLFRDAGDQDRARACYEAYLQAFPRDAETAREFAQFLRDANLLRPALEVYLQAERTAGGNRNPETAVDIGEIFLALGNLPQAEAYFQTAAAENPADELRALLGLLQTSHALGELARAEGILGQLEENFPGAVEASDLAGVQQAVARWRETQRILAEQLAALEEQRRLEEEEAKRRQAEEEEAARLAALEATDDREVVATEEETPAETTTTASTTDKLLPDDEPLAPPPPAPSPFAPARELLAEGNPGDALDLLWNLLTERSDDAEGWFLIGEAYRANGQLANAEGMYLEALRRDPDNLEFTIAYLQVIGQSRSLTRYLDELERAFLRFRDSAEINLLYGRAFARTGSNPENARFYLRRALEIDPEHPEREAIEREIARLR